jgi:hypothetical protein
MKSFKALGSMTKVATGNLKRQFCKAIGSGCTVTFWYFLRNKHVLRHCPDNRKLAEFEAIGNFRPSGHWHEEQFILQKTPKK